MSEHHESKKSLPRWLVLVVVLATGGITAVAMFATGLRGPAMAWERASKGVETVWAGDPQAASPTQVQAATPQAVQAVPPALAPMAQPALQATPQPAAQPIAQPQPVGQPQMQPGTPIGAGLPGPVVPVAAQPGVPTIIWGTPIGHGDRGPCTNCHSVVFPQGMPVPAISALSVMPHAYRGVCNNCHEVKVLPLGAPVAGVITVPSTGAMAGNPPKPMRAPTEAEWLGLEVGVAPQGVLVNGVEGMAKRAGMRVGDMITSINAVPVDTVADFVAVTQNGGLMQGTVIARREGQRLAFELGPRSGQQQRMQMEQGLPQRGAQMEQGLPQRAAQMEQGQDLRGRQMEQGQELRGRQMEQAQDQQGMRMQQGIPMQAPMQPAQL